MDLDEETILNFALLFRGGKVAIDDGTADGFRPWQDADGGFQPADGKDWLSIVADHLRTGPSIGVYPLVLLNEEFDVYWGCVDWDSGDRESWIHATNVWQVLKQLGVTSWVERSRSKGFHLWVFFKDAMPAIDVRHGLIGACALVEAPAKEVNPKQVELSNRGWGNGVRLPYGALREAGGRNEMVDPDVTFSMRPLRSFVDPAIANRVTPEMWEPVTALYSPPEGLPDIEWGVGAGDRELSGLAAAIRQTGPRPSTDKPTGDRSSTLFSLACAMLKEGHTPDDTLAELESADRDWGGKYAQRSDGQKWLRTTVANAQQRVRGET